MRAMTDLKIFFVDKNIEMCSAWKKYFFGIENVEILCTDFVTFMKKYKVDCVVSPANSYGLMDGGFDQAISDYFGNGLQKKVQRYIIDNFYGEQPVGSSFIINTDIPGIKLIHTPSMKYPSKILDPAVVYHCTRSCLIAALNGGVTAVVVPAFGGLTGEVDPDSVAYFMWHAYTQLCAPPTEINWKYAHGLRFEYRGLLK